jgi:hypothetical protein
LPTELVNTHSRLHHARPGLGIDAKPRASHDASAALNATLRSRVMAALKANHVGFLETVRMNDIERLFQEGTNVTHGSSEELTNKGRKLTNRQMPY